MRCITIDDSKVARSVVRRSLRIFGIDVEEAISAEEALGLVENDESFDIAFLDWEMPGMTGPDLLRELKARNLQLAEHIIMCTSRNATDDLTEVLSLGVSEYLMKPFTPEDLKQKLLLIGISIDQES